MHVPDAADNMINGAGSRGGRIMSKVIPRGGLYEYTEYATRTHIRNTHRDRRRTFAVGGVRRAASAAATPRPAARRGTAARDPASRSLLSSTAEK